MRRTNVSYGTIATSTGGCAGAGPTSGFSGWKSVSPAVTFAIPLTGRRTGGRPFRVVSRISSPTCAWSVAASCWSSTRPPERSAPWSMRKAAKCCG